MSQLTDLPEWKALSDTYAEERKVPIRDLFKNDSNRFKHYSRRVGGLFVDYSKNHISDKVMNQLLDLARARDLEGWRDRMFAGEKINFTENRAVLHTALRNQSDEPVYVDGEDVMPHVKRVLEHMREFVDAIHNQQWQGYQGDSITDIVNIGIGGSDLGPRMVTEALRPYSNPELKFHFVANVDGSEITEVLSHLSPATTLFIVESKTFTTQETITNALTAREWFMSQVQRQEEIAKHFVAVSTNRDAVMEFGIDPKNMFEFWDWVGGRYSLWSSIGLPIALSIGMKRFTQLLQGAYEMDQHFKNEPLRENLPVLLAMTGIWYINFHGATTHGIFPYDYYLRDLPNYLQQADMESNGKSVTRDNEIVDYATGPVIWGQTGVNGQHAYFQLLHQGQHLVPADFIVPVDTQNPLGEHHRILLANYFAQMEGLLKGRSSEEVRESMRNEGIDEGTIDRLALHRTFPGNRPSTAIILDRVTPQNLGSLLAMYEHKIFCQGIIWGLNSFDQWGVELGKGLSKQILEELRANVPVEVHGQSTDGLINHTIEHKGS
jgi:glucose-6-phosphate isomerase